MIRLPMTAIVMISLLSISSASDAPKPKKEAKPTGILVLDNCDATYRGKPDYTDNLTLLDTTAKVRFRVSGFNNCESIGSTRMIATDVKRKCIWTIENVAHRVRRFDLTGKVTLTIPDVNGSAIAVDPATGNVWVLANKGSIGTGRTDVYSEKGTLIATHQISGWDIVYDPKAKAFWIAEKSLTKISAADGKVGFSVPISTWCASSLDVDPRDGSAWVAVREHPMVVGSSNRLLKFDATGKEIAAVEFGANSPFRVSVDRKNGRVWVAHWRTAVERFSAKGKSEGRFPLAALAVQVDPAGGDVWVLTRSEVRRITSAGKLVKRVRHVGETSQGWIAAFE